MAVILSIPEFYRIADDFICSRAVPRQVLWIQPQEVHELRLRRIADSECLALPVQRIRERNVRFPFVRAHIRDLPVTVRVCVDRSGARLGGHTDRHRRIPHRGDSGVGCDRFPIVSCDIILHLNVTQAVPVINMSDAHSGILVGRFLRLYR